MASPEHTLDDDGSRPPPVDRSAKPVEATSSASPQRSLNEKRKNQPVNLSLSGAKGSLRKQQNINSLYSQVPLSPVTSFSKKPSDRPLFFAGEIQHRSIDDQGPPSPSRDSHESVNSSNSASDTEGQTNLVGESRHSTPGGGVPPNRDFYSTSLPASAVPGANRFNWSQKEINYTELAPDSPAYNSALNAASNSQAPRNHFNFSVGALHHPDTSSPGAPRLQSSRSLDHSKSGIRSITNTPETQRRLDVEYTQIDSDRTKAVGDLAQQRDTRYENARHNISKT